MTEKASQKPQQNERNDVETEEVPRTEEVSAAAETADVEIETSAGGAVEESTTEVQSVEPRSKRPRTGSLDKPQTTKSTLCAACLLPATGLEADPVLQCEKCHGTVHLACYFRTQSTGGPPTPWACDSCIVQPGVSRECVYCTQPGHSCMRRVDTLYWPASYLKGVGEGIAWGHALCAFWDPFEVASTASVVDTSTEETRTTANHANDARHEAHPRTTKSSDASLTLDFRARLELPVPPCSYCGEVGGVRIQCRRLNCGKFFHVWCANTSERGYVEVMNDPFPQRRALCDRHLNNRHELKDLVTKLTSKTMASLVPRDIAIKIQTIARRVEAYASVDAFVAEVIGVLVELSKKGLKNSKSDPPAFSMRQLQAVQLVLDHLPQLRNIYDSVTLSRSDIEFVQDTDVVHALQKAFHPQRYVRKFAGPLSQFYHCDVCREPFQERQHVFYCTSAEQTHTLHWKCTKRKSAAKESRQGGSGGAKKKQKSVSLVQQGHWKDVKLPKGLPSVGEGITCGVCRAPVDGRGVLASRKGITRLEFDKPASDFMFGGCFANEMDARTATAAGLRNSRATMVSAAQSSSSLNGHRAGSKTAPRRSSSLTSSGQHDFESDYSVLVGPPKMDRINVKRTTRWLGCLGQVIRLVLAAQAATNDERSNVADGGTTTQTTNGVGAASEAESSRMSACTTVIEIESSPSNLKGGEDLRPVDSEAKPEDGMSKNQNAVLYSSSDGTADGGEKVSTKNEAADSNTPPLSASQSSSLPSSALPYLEEAKNIVRPFDAYALNKIETAHRMFNERSGPALSVLSTLIQEYTRFMYIKHTRAVEKATNEKRKRQELEAQEERERERKRIDREAELALKKQMLAMRKKSRQ